MSSRLPGIDEIQNGFGGPPKVWTPELWDDSFSGSEGQTYGINNEGYWQRIGNRVEIWGTLNMAGIGALTPGSAAYIGELPYASILLNSNTFNVSISSASGLSLPSAVKIEAFVQNGTKRIKLKSWDVTSGQSDMAISEVSSLAEISFSGWYFTDDAP